MNRIIRAITSEQDYFSCSCALLCDFRLMFTGFLDVCESIGILKMFYFLEEQSKIGSLAFCLSFVSQNLVRAEESLNSKQL